MDDIKTYHSLDVDTLKIILKDIIKSNIQYTHNGNSCMYEFSILVKMKRITITIKLSDTELYQIKQFNMNEVDFAVECILEQLIKYYNKYEFSEIA